MVIHIDEIDETRNDNQLESDLAHKYEQLQEVMRAYGRVLVAFSGGVDSTLALKVAFDTLGQDNVLAVLAVSPSLAQDEYHHALMILDEIGAAHQIIETDEVDDPRYRENPANRCYFCKIHIGDALLEVAREEGFDVVIDGANADDIGDFRPGRQAAQERDIQSPLQAVDLSKSEVRTLARYLGLSNWNKPALACLASRVPYGTAVTPETLAQIDRAESALREMGFVELRVRHHDTLARIEVPPDKLTDMIGQRDQIIDAVRAAGYHYVTLDLQGFRSGSMNEVLRRD
jgi:uncharacterized protein